MSMPNRLPKTPVERVDRRRRGASTTLVALLILIPGLAAAEDEAALKQRVQSRSQAVVELLGTGSVYEGIDGMLKPTGQLEPPQAQLMREENKDREAIYALISEKTKAPLDDVAKMYADRARTKWPPQPQSAGIGPCKLVPAKPADVARLLQYLKQGMNYASQKKFDLALAEFQPGLAIDKNFLGLQQNVGAAQVALKKYPEAEASFKGEVKLAECLAPLNESQLASFGYFLEVDEKDPAKRRKAQGEKLKAEVPKIRAGANYNLACVYSLQKQKDSALTALRAAVDAGFSDKKSLNSDPDLAFIRQSPEFKEIVAKAR
jgi:uncharacterized protein YdbL (DUF1318 family)